MNYLYTHPNEFNNSLLPFLPPPHKTRETMPISSWICVDNSKTMLLQIVHPGGHVEFHDRPVTAGEIMCRYPRCCVAYPYVFQQPWAVVEPETVLMLGKKYYVVPNSTIRKLQRLSPWSSTSPSPACEITISSSDDEIRNKQSNKEEDDNMLSTCCVFRNKSIAKQSNIYKMHSKNSKNTINKSKIRSDVRNLSLNVNGKNGDLSQDNCFVSLFNGGRTKANGSDMPKETRILSSSVHLCDGNTVTRKRTKDLTGNGLRSSPKNVWSSEHWQPSLESITEE
ncbi:hypothetical protein VNO78_14560 [Psophocarpus tetragonolobus]|uniref:Uncharacterized protein n=1 Tax=Psophocarpus tetragonolobus TaxID=3891 RepID=A0AAN9ST29_PSOTE